MASLKVASSCYPAYYSILFPPLAKAAQEAGYSLALHGSMGRDLDLIAVPWVEEAVPEEEIVHRLLEVAGGILSREGAKEKPHGRKSWVIHLGGGAYIDLSVMPRLGIPGEE